MESLEAVRQRAEWIQVGLTLALRYAAAVTDADRRGVPLDAATVAAELTRQLAPLWTENSAQCAALNTHVAAHYGRRKADEVCT